MYPVNIKNPEENKQTNKQKKESHKMVPQSLGWWRLTIVLAHAHKPDFELLLRICFELYFFLFFFPLPFVLVLLSTLYGDRKALAVFFNRKKRLFFNVAKFPLVSIFICFNLFQWCAISCLILQIRSVTSNKLQLSVFFRLVPKKLACNLPLFSVF